MLEAEEYKPLIDRLRYELKFGNPDYDTHRNAVETIEIFFREDKLSSRSVYRVSVLSKEEFNGPIYAHRFSYPNPRRNPNLKVSAQRANVNGHPVLYASYDTVGAFLETVPLAVHRKGFRSDDLICLSE